MALLISPKVAQKLASKDPPVTQSEIRECFLNRSARTLIDGRCGHRTRLPTRWFIAETASGRRLKVVFIRTKSQDHTIKTAYEPDEVEELIYEEAAKD